MDKRKYTDEEILAGIRNGIPDVLIHVFAVIYPKITKWVQYKGASREEAQDVFMIALEAIYRKLLHGEIKLINTKFDTYLTQVCYHQWLKVCRSKSRKIEVTNFAFGVSTGENTSVEDMDKKDRYQLYLEKFEQLDESCQKLLEMFLIERKSLREIATFFEISEKYAKKKKFLCKEKLIQMIKEDPRFKEFEDGE